MGRYCCRRSAHRIKRFILLPRGSSGSHRPTRSLLSSRRTPEATLTQSRSLSCNMTTFLLTLDQCQRCVPQSHSLHLINTEDPQAQVSMAKRSENTVSQPTAKCQPTFLPRPTPRRRLSCRKTSTKFLNAHHHLSKTACLQMNSLCLHSTTVPPLH